MHLEQRLINQYNTILYQEFLLWQMKSRILWLSFGDANTRFFHIQIKIRRARQHIASLKNYDDEWIQGPQLHEFVVNHFKGLFQSGLRGEVSIPTTSYSSSEFHLQDFQDSLSHFLGDSEILSTLRSMHPLKSPDLVRLDGFHAQIFQNNWQVVGVETTEFIQTIFITSRIPMDLTRVKLVLIPKAPNPESVYQFRPISVCNTLYKLLTKILVNKLKPFLHAMIHPSQAGFVPGRRVTDNYVITQELIHYISQRKGNTYLMVAKIDLDKAYDKLERSFIKYILLFYHFPAPIIDLIMACIASASISIIWNGKVSLAFTPSRGI